MSKALLVDCGAPIQCFDKDIAYLLNQTIVIYGLRRSGKTTIVIDLIYICREAIPVMFIVSQSSTINSSFTGIVPQSCIHSTMDKEWIEDLLVRQKERCLIHKIASREDLIYSLYNKVKSSKDAAWQQVCIEKANMWINEINSNEFMDSDTRNEHIHRLQSDLKRRLVQFYKRVIQKNATVLERRSHQLTDKENICLKFLDFNPNIMLVFDDCASIFKKWVRESPSIKEIFYNGRHYNITLILTAQDDKEIDTELRKNSAVSIFTSQQAATSNFSRSANSYAPSVKRRATTCIERIFTKDHNTSNNKKLVYLQMDVDDQFMYMKADIHEPFTACCSSLWQMDRQLNTDGDEVDVDGLIKKYYK